MKLTARARYALRMMVELTRLNLEGEIPVKLPTISKTTGISRKYLEQLMIPLKRSKLVRGFAGRNGGYALARAPSSITVGQVLESVVGPVDLAVCISDPEICMRSDFCECRCIWVLLTARISAVLNDYSLADLVRPGSLQALQLLSAEAEEAEVAQGAKR